MTGNASDIAGPLERVTLLVDAGRFDDALKALAPLLAAAPDDVRVLAELCRTQLGRDAHREALQVAHAVVRADPDWSFGHLLVALALRSGKDYAGSMAAAREAIRRAPDDDRCHRALAWAASEVPGQLLLARDAAYHAVTLDPADPDNHACFGSVVMDLEDVNTAERAFAEALRLDPGNVIAQHNLAVLHTRRGKLVDATKGLLTAAALDPRQGSVPHNLDRIVWQWLGWTHRWATMAFVALCSVVVREEETGAGFVWQAAFLLALVAAGAAWWTRSTVLRVGAQGRAALRRVLRRSPLYVVRFWAVAAALPALAVVALGFTRQQHRAAMIAGAVALGVAYLASWIDLAVEVVRQRSARPAR